MRSRSFPVTLAFVLMSGAPALLASVGKPLTLAVTPDGPARGGDIVSVTLNMDPADQGKAENYAFLVAGTQAGSFPFFELTLDLIPQAYFFLGQFPLGGTIAFDFKLPDPLPPELAGATVLLEGVSGGENSTAGYFEYEWHQSNRDQLGFDQ